MALRDELNQRFERVQAVAGRVDERCAPVLDALRAAQLTPAGAVQQLRLHAAAAAWQDLADCARRTLGGCDRRPPRRPNGPAGARRRGQDRPASIAAMQYLCFDLSEGDDGIATLEAMASTPAGAAHAVALAEARQVLDWAHRHFPDGPGPVEDGHDWDAVLDLGAQDGGWQVLTLTLSVRPHVVEAFVQAFGEPGA